jgi:hypothetical protein
MDIFGITIITLICGIIYYGVVAISFDRYEQGIALRLTFFFICLIIVIVLNKIQHFSLKPFFKKTLNTLSVGIAITVLVVIILFSF